MFIVPFRNIITNLTDLIFKKASVLQGSNPKTRNLQALLQTEPILQKYFSRQPTQHMNAPPPSSGIPISSSMPNNMQNNNMANNALQSQAVPRPNVKMESSEVKHPSYPVIPSVPTRPPAFPSKKIHPKQEIEIDKPTPTQPQRPHLHQQPPQLQQQQQQPPQQPPSQQLQQQQQQQQAAQIKPHSKPNVQFTLNKFVDCLCVPPSYSEYKLINAYLFSKILTIY